VINIPTLYLGGVRFSCQSGVHYPDRVSVIFLCPLGESGESTLNLGHGCFCSHPPCCTVSSQPSIQHSINWLTEPLRN